MLYRKDISLTTGYLLVELMLVIILVILISRFRKGLTMKYGVESCLLVMELRSRDQPKRSPLNLKRLTGGLLLL